MSLLKWSKSMPNRHAADQDQDVVNRRCRHARGAVVKLDTDLVVTAWRPIRTRVRATEQLGLRSGLRDRTARQQLRLPTVEPANRPVARSGTRLRGRALIVRDRHGAEYRQMLESLCPDGIDGRELAALTGASMAARKCLSTGSGAIEAGIIRREVFADTVLQQLINDGRIADDGDARPRCGHCSMPGAYAHRWPGSTFLLRFGVFRPGVRLEKRWWRASIAAQQPV